MISLPPIPGIIFLMIFLLFTGALFYGVMERLGNYIDFVGLAVKLFHKLKSLFHKEATHSIHNKKQE